MQLETSHLSPLTSPCLPPHSSPLCLPLTPFPTSPLLPPTSLLPPTAFPLTPLPASPSLLSLPPPYCLPPHSSPCLPPHSFPCLPPTPSPLLPPHPCPPTASCALLGSNKKVASRKMARKQARLEMKARRNNKSQEGLPQHPPQGRNPVREVHKRGKGTMPLENTAAEVASGQKDSSQMSHTSTNQTKVNRVGREVLCTFCVCKTVKTVVCGAVCLGVLHMWCVYR